MIAGLVLALAAGVPGEAAPLDDIAANLRADGYEVREAAGPGSGASVSRRSATAISARSSSTG